MEKKRRRTGGITKGRRRKFNHEFKQKKIPVNFTILKASCILFELCHSTHINSSKYSIG